MSNLKITTTMSILTTLCCCIVLPMAAQQDNPTDSVHALKEVVVESKTVREKADRQLYLPTAVQRRMANNGITLLQAMQLPRIDVNIIENSIQTSAGEAVQLRINGVEATTQELMALQPKDIVRIEYHTMPGLRYGHAAAVLDYIVRHRDTGGDLTTNATNGITMLGLGDYFASGKLYSGKSAFSLMGNWERRDLKWTRENYETFHLPTYTLDTQELGRPTAIRYDHAAIHLNYSYANGDNNLLSITFRDRIENDPASFDNRNSRMHIGHEAYEISDCLDTRQNSPSLDIYFQQKLKNNQHLYVDLVTTYISSSSNRHFSQQAVTDGATNPDSPQPATAGTLINTHTDGDKYSLIGEAIYEKEFDKAKLTAGMKHTQAYTKNRYGTDLPAEVILHTAESYAFAEIQQHLGHMGYTIGLGLMRTYNAQGRQSQQKYIARPSLTITWQPSQQLFLRYNGYASAYSPSLASLSDITQGIDSYQVRRGNPNLQTVVFYANSLSVSWQSKPLSLDLYTRYSYDHKPIMDETSVEDNIIVRTEANHRGFHRLGIDASLRLRPFCNAASDFGKSVSLSLMPFFNRYVSQGNHYTHTHSNFGLRASVMAMYKHWLLSAEMKTSRHELWGETLTCQEATHTAVIGYRTAHWSLNLLMLNPFVKHYQQKQENLSLLAPNHRIAYSDDISRTLMLNFSLNLNFGKRHRTADKRINNDDTDAGILSGTKQ